MKAEKKETKQAAAKRFLANFIAAELALLSRRAPKKRVGVIAKLRAIEEKNLKTVEAVIPFLEAEVDNPARDRLKMLEGLKLAKEYREDLVRNLEWLNDPVGKTKSA
jgi:hypothetical protein